MQDDFPDFESAGLRKVSQIERALKKLHRDDQGAFIAILNALEFHLEMLSRDPATIRLLARALEAFINSRGIDPKATGIEKPLLSLAQYGVGPS